MMNGIIYTLAFLALIGLVYLLSKIPTDAVCPQCGEKVQFASIKGGLLSKHHLFKKWNGVLFEKECQCKGRFIE